MLLHVVYERLVAILFDSICLIWPPYACYELKQRKSMQGRKMSVSKYCSIFISALREFISNTTFTSVMSFNKCTLASVGFPMFVWCKLETNWK